VPMVRPLQDRQLLLVGAESERPMQNVVEAHSRPRGRGASATAFKKRTSDWFVSDASGPWGGGIGLVGDVRPLVVRSCEPICRMVHLFILLEDR
jgi:hypothetical protein